MRTQRVVLWSSLLAAGLAVMAGYSSCGGTGGGVNPFEAFQQFVSQSCSPAGPNGGGNCLTLSVTSTVPADGVSTGSFRTQLVDGSGNPLPGVQICYAFENPLVATILEPTNACGLTDQNGRISGRFRAGVNPGSFALVATAPAGFSLQIRRTVRFTESGNPVLPGNVGSPCGQSGDAACTAGSFCTNNDRCFSQLSTCQTPGLTGACCNISSECASGSCDFNTGTCSSVAGSKSVGQSCNAGSECESTFCGNGGSGDVCLPGEGDPCTSLPCGDATNVCLSGTCSAAP